MQSRALYGDDTIMDVIARSRWNDLEMGDVFESD